MPILDPRMNLAPEGEAAPSPWLTFFREVRRLAANLDALEAARNGTDEQ